MIMRWVLIVASIALLAPPRIVGQSPATIWLERVGVIRPAVPNESLGNVTGLVVLSDSTVVVAEQFPSRVARYDRSGRLIHVVMADGEGPGETRAPHLAVSNDTLVVFDPDLQRLTWLAKDGTLLTSLRLAVTMHGGGVWTTRRGEVLVQADYPSPAGGHNALRLSRTGVIDTVDWASTHAEDLAIDWKGPGWSVRGRTPFAPVGQATFDPLGRLVVGGTRRSLWHVIAGLDTVSVVRFPDRRKPIDPAVRDSAWDAWYGRLPKALPELDRVVTKDRFPTTLPPWVSLDIDARGLWWIGRPGPDGEVAAWDVAELGRIIGRVQAPDRLLIRRAGGPVAAYGDGVVAFLHEAADGEPWIGVYAVRRR